MPPRQQQLNLNPEQIKSIADQLTEQLSATLTSQVLAKLEEKMEARDTQLNAKLEEMNSAIDKTVDKTDDLEQQNRLENLRIFGVKEEQGENTDKLVLGVAAKVGVVLDPKCIGRSHRVGAKQSGKTRPIIVKFVSFADRMILFKAKKKLKGSGMSIREDLTKLRQDVLKRASETYSSDAVWSSNGVIIIKVGEAFHRVKSSWELDDLTENHPPT